MLFIKKQTKLAMGIDTRPLLDWISNTYFMSFFPSSQINAQVSDASRLTTACPMRRVLHLGGIASANHLYVMVRCIVDRETTVMKGGVSTDILKDVY